MKKIIAFLLAATMVFALGTTVFAQEDAPPVGYQWVNEIVATFVYVGTIGTGTLDANMPYWAPPQVRNSNISAQQGSGSEVFRLRHGETTTIYAWVQQFSGNENTLWIAVNDAAAFYQDHRNNSSVVSQGEINLSVTTRGNTTITADSGLVERVLRPIPGGGVPTVVEEYSFYRFVDYNQVLSSFVGTSEVEDSREFVGGSAVANGWQRGNQNAFRNTPFNGQFTGQAVLTGARITGTLEYQFVRNYVEQFERVYEWVDVVVWSDGTRVEEIQYDSEHVRGNLVDGDDYYTGPFDGTSAVNVTTGEVLLHMGHGQSAVHGRNVTIESGAFTVNFQLLNTGNNVNNTVITITGVNAGAIDTSPAPVAE